MTDGQNIVSSDREHLNRIASQYDDWYVQPLQYQLLHGELADEVARAFSPVAGTLVEFGAGTGALAVPLSEQGYDILAVDTSEGMLAKLGDKCPNLRTLQGDASELLPIDDGSAGCVLISQALHHIPNQRGVIEQAFRILKQGGKLCIFEPQLLPKPLDFLRRIARSCCWTKAVASGVRRSAGIATGQGRRVKSNFVWVNSEAACWIASTRTWTGGAWCPQIQLGSTRVIGW